MTNIPAQWETHSFKLRQLHFELVATFAETSGMTLDQALTFIIGAWSITPLGLAASELALEWRRMGSISTDSKDRDG